MGKGVLITSDGLDGIGKSVTNNSIVDDLKKRGYEIFDIHNFWKKYDDHPDFSNKKSKLYVPLDSFDVLVTSEPTFVGIGKSIRYELTKKDNDRVYSAHTIANAFSMDREILFKRVNIPAINAGKIVVQSRSVSTSIVYQPLQKVIDGEKPITIDEIMNLSGNALALQYAPDLLIIPTIKDVKEVMRRLENREKKDDSRFENMEFQLKIKPLYESKKLKKIFESRGSTVTYIDVGKTIEYTQKQSIDIYTDFMTKKGFFK